MKQLLTCAVVAAVVSLLVLGAEDLLEREGGGSDAENAATRGPAVEGSGAGLGYTEALIEDVWINGARGAGSDRRTLTDASSSICYLTKIEIKGVQGPEDANSCVIEVDDFTGFWQLAVSVEEGGRSEVRCNARCLTWESGGLER
jgi:hypothetical protein